MPHGLCGSRGGVAPSAPGGPGASPRLKILRLSEVQGATAGPASKRGDDGCFNARNFICSCPGYGRGGIGHSDARQPECESGRRGLAVGHAAYQCHRDIDRQVRLYGPGDVTGIDPRQVVRTEPSHLATAFEPNYFPAIEFDRPDFPWLFTPAKADAEGRLRPWLCLVVVRKQEGVTLRVDRNLPLPVLEIKAPARPERELPDLSESWAWAHAQVAGSRRDAEVIEKSLAGDPALTVSRLLCPRRLDPLTDYLACVVPAFELGCKAGLGVPIEPADENAVEIGNRRGVRAPKLPRR